MEETKTNDLQSEIDKLKAENAALKGSGCVVQEDEAPLKGMTASKGQIITVIPQHPYKQEKLAPTTRCDAGYDPSQTFGAGRQP